MKLLYDLDIFNLWFFNDAVTISVYIMLNDRVVPEHRVWNDVRNRWCSVIWGTVPSFVWRHWRKSRKPEIRIANFLARIRTGHPPECNSSALPLQPPSHREGGGGTVWTWVIEKRIGKLTPGFDWSRMGPICNVQLKQCWNLGLYYENYFVKS
jgi:hypothetical protein